MPPAANPEWKCREEQMVRSILCIAALAMMVVAGPAQAAEPVAGELAAAGQLFADAFNRKDAAAVAALYTDDAVIIRQNGIVRGRDAIHKDREAAVKAGHDLKLRYHASRIEGNSAWSFAEFEVRGRGKDGADILRHGYSTTVWVRDAGKWKIQVQGFVAAPSPKAKD
jgi:ketosteroid isomerase-like protein